jgi:hypothetical protein
MKLIITPKSLKRFHRFGFRILACFIYWTARSIQTKASGKTVDFNFTYVLLMGALYVFWAYIIVLRDPHYWATVVNGFIRFCFDFDGK